MKTFAIADLHGSYDLLLKALAAIKMEAETGTVIFLGDYIDRGPHSNEIIETLMEGPNEGWNWICLMGNHEDMMVEAVENPDNKDASDMWLHNGGVQTLMSFGYSVPNAAIEWCKGLPVFYRDKHRVYVHAYIVRDYLLAQQKRDDMIWGRFAKKKDEEIWSEGYIVHGHTAYEDGPHISPGRINLDTAALWSGKLAIAVFDDDVPGPPVKVLTVRR